MRYDSVNYQNLQNVQNKISTIKGSSAAGTIFAGLVGVFFVIIGILGLTQKDGFFAGLLFLLVGGGIAYVCFGSIPKEKKQVAESWAKLTPAEINRIEMEAPTAPVAGTSFVTHDAVVKKTSQGPLVIPARDIMWVYGKQVTHKAYGVITTGKTMSAIIVAREANKHELGANKLDSETQVKIIYSMLKPNYPGIIFGYRQDIEAYASKENISMLAQFVDSENRKARS